MKYILIVMTTLLSTALKAQHSLEKIWETDSVFLFSEGVVPEPGGKFLFVSNTIGSPMAKDGKGSISKVGFDGKIIDLNWVTEGMNAPKDIQVFKNLIYLADLDEVIVVDIDKAAVVQRIRIEGATLLPLREAAEQLGVVLTVKRHAEANGSINGAVVWTWPATVAPPPALRFENALVAVIAYGRPARAIAASVRERGGTALRLGPRWFIAQARRQRSLWESAT